MRAGFTMVEILLAIGLLAVLAAVLVSGFSAWYDTERIDEGARRLESVLRMARADAASRGRRIRMRFDPETLQPVIEWEPQPLVEPGVYAPHPAGWSRELPNGLLVYLRCQKVGADALQVMTYEDQEELTSDEGGVLQELKFYPDGSYDSAIIEVGDPRGIDQRVGRVDLDGANGTINMRILTPLEREEQDAIDEEAAAQ